MGDQEPSAIPPDDVSYVRDLGLIKTEGQLTIANPIYQEVIPRELTYSTQLTISEQPAWYIRPDGRLDLPKLLAAFQQFFREHSESWLERFDYKEAGPQLLLQAFLQRILNGGGRVDREYGLGRRRTDLLIVWNYPGGVQRAVIELKLLLRRVGGDHRHGAGADLGLRRCLRRRGGPPGDLRPHARQALGRENLAAAGAPPRSADHGVGLLSSVKNSGNSIVQSAIELQIARSSCWNLNRGSGITEEGRARR